MDGITFLIILAWVLIVMIIVLFISQTHNYTSLKSYHKIWELIYENRKKHFDVYLKEALENSKSTESPYGIAKLAARLRLEEERKELKDDELEKFELFYGYKFGQYINEYEHELRSANIE